MSPELVGTMIAAQAEVARMEAAKIANHERISNGLSPAYDESHFDYIAHALDNLSIQARELQS